MSRILQKWRVRLLSVACDGNIRNDTDLLCSDMVYKLATPAAEGDYSWIKPGKVAWDWWNDWNLYGVDFRAGVNTETYKYYIDFASKFGIEYVIWMKDGRLPDRQTSFKLSRKLI